jgi:hypothetical protein
MSSTAELLRNLESNQPREDEIISDTPPPPPESKTVFQTQLISTKPLLSLSPWDTQGSEIQ